MYEGLLLSTGGGIITDLKKSAQQGEPTIIIGLGGTGVDALKVVKKKVYEQLMPDNPKDAIPEYKHIGFLAIDTDKISTDSDGKGFHYLKEEECLNISVSNLNAKMDDDIKKKQPEFAWLQPGLDIKALDGAGTIRQVGRYSVFKNIDRITNKLKSLKKDVTMNTGKSNVNIHILAGISGGTGSGTFIDMCYIVRDLMGVGATLFGYFFMPDVNLNKPGIPDAITVRIKDNGYAALKELDYTMNLGNEGKAFSQYYGGNGQYVLQETSKPLVDLCHLVSATEENGTPIDDGYMYSMNVVGEYILSYLAQVQTGASTTPPPQTLAGHLSNVQAAVGTINKIHGENLNYHILGASTTELPTKEIGTYLAAKLYKRIGSGLTENVPTYNDVENHAEKMELTLGDIQDKLYGKNPYRVTDSSNIRWQGKNDFSITDAINTTVSITGSKITLTMPDEILDPIRSWKNENSGILEKNFNAITKDLDDFKLITKGTKADTLVSSVFQYLQNNVVSNFSYGAIYASKLMYNNHDKSLNDYLDGLITTAEHTVSQWQGDLDLRAQSIENAVVECKKNIKKRFKKPDEAVKQYKGAVRAYYQTQLDIEVGEKIIEAIAILKKQINLKGYKNSLYPMYFKPMESMLIELKETFKSNLEFLHNPAVRKDVFVWKMVEFDEIEGHVDAAFDTQIKNEDTEYKNFVKNIMDQQEEWIEGNRYKVEKMITSYIATEFSNLLSASMENYLNDKYNTHGHPQALQQAVQTDLLNNGVLAKAAPKFHINSNFTKASVAKHDLSVPIIEANICAAAQSINTGIPITVRCTGLSDRIFAVKFESGIPLYAYGLIKELENQYNKGGAKGRGRHLYEITDRNKDISWVNLQSFIPYSVKKSVCTDGKELEQLYYDAEKRGIITEDQNDSNSEYNVYELNKPVMKNKNDFMKEGTLDINELNIYIKGLESYIDSNGMLDVTPNSDGSNNDNIKDVKKLLNDGSVVTKDNGNIDYREQCRIDYFIRFRGLQEVVKESMKILDDVEDAIKEAEKWQNEGAEREETVKLITNALCFDFFEAGIGKYTYNGVDLWNGTMEYSKFPVYQIYKIFNSDAFTNAERKALGNDVNNKLNTLEPADAEKVEKIKAKYIDNANTGIISVMKQAAVLPEYGDIETVYKLFEGEIQALLNLFAM